MKDYILECSVDSVESAIAAEKGGANRLELCSALVIGGLTPSKALFEQVKKHTNIRIHVLLRPRYGDFCYTNYEHQIIKEEIKIFKELRADGVVIGTLKSDGTLNVEQMKELIDTAEGMPVTMHRAFDMCKNPMQTLMDAKKLGINTILTSGQKNNCIDGIDLLKHLVQAAGNDIDILIGSGVDASIIEELYEKTKATSYHMSGKVVLDSHMQYRKDDVNMGVKGMNEYQIWRTSSERIRTAKEVLEKL